MRLETGVLGIEHGHQAFTGCLEKGADVRRITQGTILYRDVEPRHGRVGEQATQRRGEQLQSVRGRGVVDALVAGAAAQCAGPMAGEAVFAGKHVFGKLLPCADPGLASFLQSLKSGEQGSGEFGMFHVIPPACSSGWGPPRPVLPEAMPRRWKGCSAFVDPPGHGLP